MRCVSYTRFVSSMPETETPSNIIKQQNDRIGKFAREHTWSISQKYSDRKNDKNADAAFKQMKQDGMARDFDLLIIDSFYRLGTNVAVAKNLLFEVFYPSGIHFAVVEDDFCSMGKSQAELKKYFAEKYADHRTKIRWSAIMEKREEGFFNVHDERYGYLLSNDHRELVIDEEAAMVIREVFQMTADGMTMAQIADSLNERGYDSPAIHLEKVSQKKRFKGHKEYWTANTVKTVSSCSQYLGKTRKKIRDDYVEYDIPQIVDDDLYQKALEAKRKHFHGCPHNRAAFNPFKFIIFDKRTGESLLCVTNQENRSKRYFCIGRKSTDPTIPFETVYEEVLRIIKREIEQSRNVAAMLCTEEAEIIYNEKKKAITRSLRRIMKHVSDISEERIQLNSETDAEEIRRITDDTEQRLKELEVKYLKKLDEMNSIEKAFKNNPWCNLYKDIVIDENFDDTRIRKLVEAVWVRDIKFVTADMKEQEWKSMLPRNWRKGESANGTKE